MITPATIAAYASALTVLVGVTFGVLTLRQWRRTRYLAAAAELVHTIQTPEFTHAIGLVMALPERADVLAVQADPACVTAIHAVAHVFESLGVLVFYRLLPLHLVDQLLGGYLRASWRRVQPYVEMRRTAVGAMFGEWFQWLFERMEEDPAPGKAVGAPVAHRSWKT
ncbi:MAG TPA: hypothetical protein VG389_24475 [Myxococcota bacterium]|nr:hypothetical protein [Myxococcota bacterium]